MSTSREALIVADFTVQGLAPYLADAEPPSLKALFAPFNQVVPVLLDGALPCWASKPDVAVVWTRPDSAVKSFARVLGHESVAIDDLLREVDEFAQCLRTASTRVSALFVPTWTWPAYDRGLGVLNLKPGIGAAYALMKMNARLAEAVADSPSIHLLDAARWVTLAGRAATSPKLWHLGKIAFGPEVFKHAAADIKAALRAIGGQARKLVVLDLDDTLWGGIVGDVGWEGLNLGGHSPIGESFAAFQRALKKLTQRGIVLGVVSKNTEAIALEAIDQHPEMVLRRSDFVAWRINWQDKAQNIASLVSELNLGLDSVVFIDDNPAERARVREALPQVLVPEWPQDKLLYEQALAELACFDTVTVSAEDRARTRSYVSEREREAVRQSAQSVEEYLAALGLTVDVELLSRSNLPRAAQLLNKTNQLNLRTRRFGEAQYHEWASSGTNRVLVFRVRDRFDDYGLTGLASLSVNGGEADVQDFVLSCRVMGRGVEQTMLHALVEEARSLGVARLVATYVPTPRNGPVKTFFDDASGFARDDDTSCYSWDLSRIYAAPSHVEIKGVPAGQPQ
jgi:FkbH-like protein